MKEAREDDDAGVKQTSCVVCGTSEVPEKGWIYRSQDVKPVELDGDKLVWEEKDGAKAFCSIECKNGWDGS